MSEPVSNSNNGEPTKPYIAIVVLVCGVIGGLIIVISFIFFCKFCFKKSQPLASATSPTEKNEPYVIKPKSAKTGYQILDGTNSLASPVPADLETYLQQPINTNNNNLDLKPDFLLVNQTKAASQKKLCQLAEDELLIVQTEIADEEEKRARRHHSSVSPYNHSELDSLFQRCATKLDSDDIEVLSIKHAANNRIKDNQPSSPYANSKRQRAFSNATVSVHHPKGFRGGVGSRMNTLSVEDPTIEPRRRSFDERLTGMNIATSPGGKRRLPNVAQLNDYYANEYDRKQYSNDTSLIDDEAQMNSLSTEEVSLQVPAWIPKSPQVRSPGAHLPRSHQTITDKTSPPRRPRLTSELPIESPKIYPRDHRHSKSYGVAEQDLSGSNKNMYTRDHRLAFSFTDTGEERRLPMTQPIILLSPEHRSEASSMNSGYEADTLNRFYRQCQEIFNKAPPGYVSALSSSSSGNQYAAVNGGRLTSRQVKSVELAERFRTTLPDRQAQSLDNNCKVCLTDAMNRMSLYNEEIGPRVGPQHQQQQYVSGGTSNFLRRQRPLDDADLELDHLEDAQSEEIKTQCKQLWSLRSILETDRFEGEAEEEDEEYVLHSPDGDDGGGTTSYTTSFESNTEPLTMEDYLRSTRPSGPFLEPPRLSLEAKRAKLKSLYAKRQMNLQQQGVSVESYESYDTIDSSESSKPEQIATSFESNQGEQTDSTVDSRRKMVTLQKDSGYKSQSTETSHLHDMSFDKILTPSIQLTTQQKISPNLDQSFDSNASELMDIPDVPAPPAPAPADHHRSGKHYATSRERDVAEAFFQVINNGNETDSNQPSGESFDDTQLQYGSGSGVGFPTPKYPNVHLARMRRSFQMPSTTTYKSVMSRDYSVDAATDAMYREFVKFDPRLETRVPLRKSNMGRYSNIDVDSPKIRRSFKQKLSTEDSIEEEHMAGGHHASTSYDYRSQGQGRYDIPIIKLSDDNEIFSGVKVQ